jgi:uncharacterized hydrophobic protein (TIGR00271 family)
MSEEAQCPWSEKGNESLADDLSAPLQAKRFRASLADLISRLANRRAAPRTPVVRAQLKLSRDFRVLLPVAKLERAEQLAPLAAALAAANDGEVVVVHFEAGSQPSLADKSRPALERARQIVAEAGVPVHSTICVGRDAVSGIFEAAREIQANVIVMGWRPKPHTRDRLLGRTLDPLLADPPCSMLVQRAGAISTPRRILVPLAGGPNAIRALGYALQLAEQWDGQVTAFTVIEHTTPVWHTAAKQMLREAAGKYAEHPRLELGVVAAASPIDGILQAAADHDLVMIGASREGVIDRVLFGDIPERVASQSSAPVIVVKRRVGLATGWLRRALDRASATLPSLSFDERVEVYKTIRRAARPDADYFVMIGLAAGIAALGLLLNSPAVIIGAMLVAPLMAAIVGLGMGVVMGDMRLLKIAASATMRGMLLAVGIGVVAGWLAIDPAPTAEILGRTRPTLLDLGVALVSGAAGAYALCREDVSASLPGVAIAAALVPPLATAGIGLSTANAAVAGGALLLFMTNLVAISAASAAIFLLFGFRPAAEAERINILRRGAIAAITSLVIVAAALGVLTFRLVRQLRFEQDVRAAVTAQVARLGQAKVVEIEMDPLAQDALHLQVTIQSRHSVSYEETVALQKEIAVQLDRPVALVLVVVPATQLDPLIPPTYTPTPTHTPTPTPGPSATPTRTPTPSATTTPSATATPSPSSTAIPSATSTQTPTFTPTLTFTPTPVMAAIAHTGGAGVFMRDVPGGKVLAVLSETAPVQILYRRETVNDVEWVEIRDALGRVGWVAARFVAID